MRIITVMSSILAAIALAGCAPVVSGAQIVKANVAVSAAETAGAKQGARYEYHAALEYLQKAREEASYSDFAAARDFANKALDFAVRARAKAETVSQAEQPMAPPPPANPSPR